MDLLLSDIHANLHALRAVPRWARRRKIDRYVVLGDLVGYGAHPGEVIARIQALEPCLAVRGNHDTACWDPHGGLGFSLPAREAVAWTRAQLPEEQLAFLRGLPRGPVAVGEGYLIAHGSPGDENVYLLHPSDIRQAFEAFQGPLCFFGHTHMPGLFELGPGGAGFRWFPMLPGEPFDLKGDCRYLVNPGSVGQPRDRDPRASCMGYDPVRRRVCLYRIPYDVEGAAAAIRAASLHPSLADRLREGL